MQEYSGAQFIAPIQGPILGISPVTGTAGDWEYNLRGSYRSTTTWPRLQSGCWLDHVLMKGVPWVLLLWFDSNSWVRILPPYQACHTLRGGKEENVYVYHDSYYYVYLSFTYTNCPVDYQCVTSLQFLRPSLQIWRRWWNQSGFPIIHKLGRHLVSPIFARYVVPPPLIWCGPEELTVYIVRWEGFTRTLDELFTNFIMTCNDKASVTEANSVTYAGWMKAAIDF